jgi:alginate O-acetyltransferase complex protein AlgI
MSFNSIHFSIFFLSIAAIYYVLPGKSRWVLVLFASYLFYAFLDIRYIILLFASTVIDYYVALLLVSTRFVRHRKTFFALSLVVNLSLIFGFKYINLFDSLVMEIASLLGVEVNIPYLKILAPVGISFYTLKKLSYVIDVFQGKIAPENNFGQFALYVSHFLEIMSGPIDRAGSLIPQIKNPRSFDVHAFSTGIMTILWGLFLKVVVADRLAIYTDAVFHNIVHHQGPTLLLAAYFYSFQIYCDFAGYTNMAIGCGRLLGIDIMPNFNLPYLSVSISDFWRRWHMTLSYWFRDYLYIPLGGSRVSSFLRCRNYLAVFLLCGLWHGANWTFVVWGGIHGLYLIISHLTYDFRKRVVAYFNVSGTPLRFIQVVSTFHLVTFAWIFFRSSTIHEAWNFIIRLFSGWPRLFIDMNSIGYGICGITIVIIKELLQYNDVISLNRYLHMPISIRWACVYVLMFIIILAGVDSESAFIYFQF